MKYSQELNANLCTNNGGGLERGYGLLVLPSMQRSHSDVTEKWTDHHYSDSTATIITVVVVVYTIIRSMKL